MPGYPCCCSSGFGCDDCTSTAPTNVTVDISTIADDECTDCTGLDDSYSVPEVGLCHWNAVFVISGVGASGSEVDPCDTDYNRLEIDVWVKGFTIEVDIELRNPTWNETHLFVDNTPDYDCANWLQVDIPYSSKTGGLNGYSCDFSGATVEITAS